MMKRIACMILTLILLVSLVPAAAISASAASYTISEAAITVLKKMTTLKTSCYQVADSSEFRIGYGTVCNVGTHSIKRSGNTETITYYDSDGAKLGTKEIKTVSGATTVTCKDANGTKMNMDSEAALKYSFHNISEKQADALLREYLAELDKQVDSFASSNKVTLTQAKHDALVVFSYGVGTAWMSGSNAVKTAIIAGYGSSDLLKAMVSVYGGEERRKVEVNMYCNGVYSNVVPSSYNTVYYNPGATDAQVAGQGAGQIYEMYMDSSVTISHPVVATRKGYEFIGWYLDNKLMPNLTSECKTKTLVAHWQENGKSDGVDALYKVYRSDLPSQTVYKNHDTDSTALFNLSDTSPYKDNSQVEINKEYIDSDGVRWGLLSDGAGWIILNASGNGGITIEHSEGAIAKATVTYSGGYVNVRSSAGTGYDIIGSVSKGQTLDIFEIRTVNGHKWGRIASGGWFCLTYASVTMLGNNTDVDVTSEGALAYTYEAKMTGAPSGVYVTSSENSNEIDSKYTDDLVAGKSVTVTNMTKNAEGMWVKISWVAKYKETIDGETYDRETTAYGWILLQDPDNGNDALSVSSQPVQISPVTYTVAADELTVRKEPTSAGSTVFRMNKGVQFEVKTIRLVGEEIWGETVELYVVNDKYSEEDDSDGGGNYMGGWVNLSSKYVSRTNLPTVQGGNNLSPIGKTATIVNTDNVRVRITCAIYGRQVGTLPRGTTANILEIEDGWYNLDIDVDDDPETGSWVYEDYVEVNDGYVGSESSNTTTVVNGDGTATTTTTVGKGVVANTYSGVNVRQGAGIGYALVGKLLPGTVVDILETQNGGAATWGRTEQGWVCMDYITMISTTTTTTTKTTGNGQAVQDLGTVAKTTTTAVYTGKIKEEESTSDEQVIVASADDSRKDDKYVWTTPKHNQDPDYAVRQLSPGEVVTIYELLEVTEVVWVNDETGDYVENAENPDYDEQTAKDHGESTVSKETVVSYWARTSDGYIFNPQASIVLDPLDEKVHTLTGNDTLNIRNDANGGTIYGQLEKGDQVKVTELKIVNDKVWGKIDYEGDGEHADNNGFTEGWIRLDYMSEGAYYVEKTTNTTTTTTNTGATAGNIGNTGGGFTTNTSGYRYTGKVINTNEVNVRQTPSTTAGKTTVLKNGASLVIYETTIAENMAWGRCDAGWVYLYYVDLTPVANGVVDARVVYNDNTVIYSDVNGTSTVGTYARMSVIDIYEIVGKMARTDQGWVNTDNLL